MKLNTVLCKQIFWILLLIGLACTFLVPMITASLSGELKLGDGVKPAASSNGTSLSVVVWEADDGDSSGIVGLRLDQLGLPLGIEFRVNPSITGTQRNPDVAMLPSGEFVVVWENEDDTGTSILGQRFTDTGLPLGIEFSVQAEGRSATPVVEADGEGNFVVAWAGSLSRRGKNSFRHWVQRFDSDAMPLDSPRALGRKGPATPPTLAVQPTGEHLIAWENRSKNIRGVVRDSYGNIVSGGTFRINKPGGKHAMPSAGVTGGNEFTVTWQKKKGSRRSIQVRPVIDTGIPAGIEFQVNVSSVDRNSRPSIATDNTHNAVVVWQSETKRGGLNTVLARPIDQGIPAGIEFVVNPASTGLAGGPDVTPESPTSFLVVWDNLTNSPTAASGSDPDILATCVELVP